MNIEVVYDIDSQLKLRSIVVAKKCLRYCETLTM